MAVQEQVFGFFIPTVTLMGVGAHKEIGNQIKVLGGTKPFICTDKGITAAGIADRVAAVIKAECEVEPVIYDGTHPNPTDNNVHEGYDMYKASGCDLIVSLGGGSAHDCGKGIGIIATNGGNIRDYEGVDKSSSAMPPFIAVNTTAGTASEMTRFCIITDTSRKVKMAIVDWRVTPNVAIDDPLLMVGMPPALTAATGMDALTHAVEACLGIQKNPISDAVAASAIRLIFNNLVEAVRNGKNLQARLGMANAATLAGIAFSNSMVTMVHAIGHSLGAVCHLPHGDAMAICLPDVLEFNLDAIGQDLGELLLPMAGATEYVQTPESQRGARVIEKIRELRKTLHDLSGLPITLKEAGVSEDKMSAVAEISPKDGAAFYNRKKFTAVDALAVLKKM